MAENENATSPDADKQSDSKKRVVWGLLILILPIAAFFIGKTSVDELLPFNDVAIVSAESFVKERAGGGFLTLPLPTSDEEMMKDLVGQILVGTADETEEWAWEFVSLISRPSRKDLATRITDELLFEGIVKTAGDFKGHIPNLSASGGSEELAEITIRNRFSIGYSDPQKIPYKELRGLNLKPGKIYYFIDRVIVGEIHKQRFQKWSGNGKLEGKAFGAESGTYFEKGLTTQEKFVYIRKQPLRPLQPSEAGPATHLNRMARDAAMGQLNSEKIQELREELAKAGKRDTIEQIKKLSPPSPSLPEPVSEFRVLKWYDRLPALKQSTPSRCWIAAAAMVCSQGDTNYTEESLIESMGPDWVRYYRDPERRLTRSEKVEFLKKAKLSYHAPASLLPAATLELLEKHGPLWFTIEHRNGGRHAVIVTGLFLDEETKTHWVSYLDPENGQLESETYWNFHQRYEQVAINANTISLEAAQTEADLDLQVIYLAGRGKKFHR